MTERVTVLVGVADPDQSHQIHYVIQSGMARFSSPGVQFKFSYPSVDSLRDAAQADIYLFFITRNFEYSSIWCRFVKQAISNRAKVFTVSLDTSPETWQPMGAVPIAVRGPTLKDEDGILIASQLHLTVNCLVEERKIFGLGIKTLSQYAAFVLSGAAMGAGATIFAQKLSEKNSKLAERSVREFVSRDLNHARAALRVLIKVLSSTDSDLDALMLDYFPRAAKVCSSGMDQVRKCNFIFNYYNEYSIYSTILDFLRNKGITKIQAPLSADEHKALRKLHEIVAELQRLRNTTKPDLNPQA